MDYIEWCHRVLDSTVEAHSKSGSMRSIGVDEHRIARELFPHLDVMAAEFHPSPERMAILDALRDLVTIGVLDESESGGFYAPSGLLTQLGGDFLPLWRHYCDVRLTEEQEEMLRAVAPMSEATGKDFASVEWVEHPRLLAAVRMDDLDDGWHVAKALDAAGLIHWSPTMGTFKAHITYLGLVWLGKRGETRDAEEMDRLVAEWETTSVEFKRELGTGTVDEKAEMIKDLLALANTQASVPRLLIIGFDPKTHEHVAAPDPAITQDHLEQLVSVYIAPNLIVRYSVVDYRGRSVGRLEVVREPAKLPYAANKELRGMKRVLAVGDWFVRHGSQAEEPTPAERQAIMDEGERARGD
jgi:hypothetical protein